MEAEKYVEKFKEERDLYKILGIEQNASHDDIKSAYKKLALQFHPDKNKTQEATAAIQIVNRAYEILGDEEKR